MVLFICDNYTDEFLLRASRGLCSLSLRSVLRPASLPSCSLRRWRSDCLVELWTDLTGATALGWEERTQSRVQIPTWPLLLTARERNSSPGPVPDPRTAAEGWAMYKQPVLL